MAAASASEVVADADQIVQHLVLLAFLDGAGRREVLFGQLRIGDAGGEVKTVDGAVDEPEWFYMYRLIFSE